MTFSVYVILFTGIKIYILTRSLVSEPEYSTPILPKLAILHDPKPVPSTSHPHNYFDLMSFSHLLLGLANSHFPRCFPIKMLYSGSSFQQLSEQPIILFTVSFEFTFLLFEFDVLDTE
jgi:hypothetical protein